MLQIVLIMAAKNVKGMEGFGNIDKKSIENKGKLQAFSSSFCVFLPKLSFLLKNLVKMIEKITKTS